MGKIIRTSMTDADHVTAFLDAMHAAGVEPTESIAHRLAAGEFVRFHCDGDRKGKANGWARLFLDGRAAGRFGNHRLALDVTWKADAELPSLTPAERRAARERYAAQRQENAAKRLKDQEATADRAAALAASSKPAETTHPYLMRKRVAGEGVRQSGDMLLVPMADDAGRIWNVQRIFPDGAKRFLTGGRIEGLSWRIGGSDGPLCLGEGFGTMAAVRRATGHAVVVAFAQSNLEKVARQLRTRWPSRDIIVCADDDAHLVHNPRIRRNLGVDAAQAAAAAIGARVAMPPRSSAHG